MAVAVSATCSGNEAPAGALRPPAAPDAQQPAARQPVALTRLAPGAEPLSSFSGLSERTRLVVRDAAEWKQAWSRIWGSQTPPALPAVDFTREMVIIAGTGTRSSGGHRIAIDSAYIEGGTLHVVVRTEAPGANCLTSQALTAPVDVARVPRSEGQVTFSEMEASRSC
jgi:hypothetical protein